VLRAPQHRSFGASLVVEPMNGLDIVTFGCRLNAFESEEIRAALAEEVAKPLSLVDRPFRLDPALKPTAEERGPEVIVADNGPGIPAGEKEKVFRRFYRLDSSRGTPGNSLGLALVAAIRNLHGIGIRLSDNDARGPRVSLAFAASDAQQPTEDAG
jgi:signal transduction histidine kinase